MEIVLCYQTAMFYIIIINDVAANVLMLHWSSE